MQARTHRLGTYVLVCCGALAILAGCGDLSSIFGETLSGQTTLTSTTLSGDDQSAQTTVSSSLGVDGLSYTPSNVTGKVLSLLFAIDEMEDEGIVVFGDERPDIAPATSALYDFDLANPDPITSTIMLKPGYVGGPSSMIVLLFGYMDMEMTINGSTKTVRIALADIDDMQRGDKLLLDDTTNTYQWYDLDTASFVSTRPTNPAAIAEIRDFTDPIRPNLVFYPINVELLQAVQLDLATVQASTGIDAVIDFVMTDAVVLVDETDETTLTDADIITSLDLIQNVSGYESSGFHAGAQVTLTP